ncbi:hypothetical protein [Methylorubrum populi]|uniref:hypothetical protein n=1 Tax=Methylorubrum populi TaxID=223967 RepID=UPI002355572C|nr:hypothetical protein [Methylorubrum populi]
MPKGSTSTFSVQAFRAKGKGLEAEPARSASSEEQALRMVDRMAADKAGVVAVRQDGHPGLGEFEEPIVLKVVGRVPEYFTDTSLIPF